MSRLKFLPPDRLIPPETPAEEDAALAEVRARARTSRKDIVWVAVGLAIVLIVSWFYQSGAANDRRAAERQAQLRAATEAALPPPGYDARTRYPTAGELEADANVREARALIAANAAQNATDPMLSAQPPAKQPMPLPTSPKPFSDPYYASAGAVPPPAPRLPEGPPK